LNNTVTSCDLVCIVIFRGSWCKYDQYYLQRLGHFIKTVDTIGILRGMVRLIAWTSEGAVGANIADREWELQSKYGYNDVIGDETNALANWLIEDEILPHLRIKSPSEAKVSNYIGTTDSTLSYPNGIAMPGIVWYAEPFIGW
jgi:hypothetical protein